MSKNGIIVILIFLFSNFFPLIFILHCEALQSQIHSTNDSCYSPNSTSLSPHVYFINLPTHLHRRKSMESYLSSLHFQFTHINAIAPSNLTNFPREWIQGEQKRMQVIVGCTTSHLEAIFQALINQGLIYPQSSTQKNSTRSNSFDISNYALITEDDILFQFQILDWKALIDSAPPNWSILQLFTSNTPVLNSFWNDFQSSTISPSSSSSSCNSTKTTSIPLWLHRQTNRFWSTGAYLVHLPSLVPLFDSYSPSELSDINSRFHSTKTFHRKCDLKDSSMSARLRCAGKIYATADRFIYSLGGSHVYVSSLPLVSTLPSLPSTMSTGHSSLQDTASKDLKQLALSLLQLSSSSSSSSKSSSSSETSHPDPSHPPPPLTPPLPRCQLVYRENDTSFLLQPTLPSHPSHSLSLSSSHSSILSFSPRLSWPPFLSQNLCS